jgi:hypothetical protein
LICFCTFDDNEKDMLRGRLGPVLILRKLVLDNGDDAERKDKITELRADEFALDLDFIGI